MDSDPNIPASLAEQIQADFAHQPPAQMDSYVLDVAHSFKTSTPWWRSKSMAAAAAILIVTGGFWTVCTRTYHQPTVLDAFDAARALRNGDKSIKQSDVDSILAAAVKVPGRHGGS